MAHIAVILSGCGYLDGAEIREAVLTLLYLDQQGTKVTMFAPDQPQADTLNHLDQTAESSSRNVLTESARIARGQVKPLSELQADVFDGIILPGGYGAAKNLSDVASKGADATVLPTLSQALETFHAQSKPIGAICIAPAVLAVALKGKGLTLTIGEDADTAAMIESLGHKHKICASDEVAIDEANRVASCSAYMREDALAPIAKGIERTVEAVLNMTAPQTTQQAS